MLMNSMTHISDITVPAVVTAATCLTGPFSDLGGGVSKTAETHSGCLHVHGAQRLQNVSEYIK